MSAKSSGRRNPDSGGTPNGRSQQGGGTGPEQSGEKAISLEETKLFQDGTRYWLLVGLVFAISVAMRLAFISADPPWDFTWSQDVFTDGARVVDGARNQIVFGHWITDPRSPVVLFYPISSIIAWVFFKIGGIGLAQANLTSVFPALASLALMFYIMRKAGGNLAGLLGLVLFGFSDVHVIFSRIPMVESLLILMLLGSFWLALGGRREVFLSGLLLGFASFMVKIHALHFVPVFLVFLLVSFDDDGRARGKKHQLALSFLAGIGVALVVWIATIYAGHAAIVAKYFRSNILLSQNTDYTDLTLDQMVVRRIGGVMHVGAGRDGFFVKIPATSIAAYLGLLGLVSRFSWRRPRAPRWEVFAGIWFVALVLGLSLLSYRPLRYLTLFIPSLTMLAVAFLVRLARGEPWLAPTRPRWFVYFFGVWLAWVILHLQQDIVFQIMTGGRSIVLESLTDFQKALYKYQFSVYLQLAIYGGASLVTAIMLKEQLLSGNTKFPQRWSRNLFYTAMVIIVSLDLGRFTGYALDRKYSIVETEKSLRRILPDSAFIVGDCANTVALGTRFQGLPAYGDLMRYEEKADFERYPVTHFLLRYPALYNYLKDNYPDFADSIKPIRLYGLCGREATLLRYEGWPAYPKDTYKPSVFEEGTDLLNEGKPDDAMVKFQQFLNMRPDSYEALWGLAVCELQKGEYDKCKAYIERSLELTKTDALSYEVYADVFDKMGQEEQALKYWQMALKFSPGNKRVFRKIDAARGTPDD